MIKNLQLHIPVPCHENWNNMSPDQQGRHCMSCQKTVVDFTYMTDQELLLYFKNARGNTCGRFTDDQLNREIRLRSQKKLKWFKYMLQMLIPTLFATSSLEVRGQAKRKHSTTKTTVYEKVDMVTMGIIGPPISDRVMPKIAKSKIIDTFEIEPKPVSTEKKFPAKPARDKKFLTKPSMPIPVPQMPLLLNNEIMIDREKNLPLRAKRQPMCGNSDVVIRMGYVINKPRTNVIPNSVQKMLDSLKKLVSQNSLVPKYSLDLVNAMNPSPSSIKLFPNPFRSIGILNIEYAGKQSGNYVVQIIDISGKILQIYQLHTISTNLKEQIRIREGLAANTYVIALIDPDGKRVASEKLFVVE